MYPLPNAVFLAIIILAFPLALCMPHVQPLPEASTNLTLSFKNNSGRTGRSIYYCHGRAGASESGDLGCGGPCMIYHEGDPTNCNSASKGKICARGTNCIETDGRTEFTVCDSSMTYCNGPRSFRPGRAASGRFIYNTVKTGFIYVKCVGDCLSGGQSDDYPSWL